MPHPKPIAICPICGSKGVYWRNYQKVFVCKRCGEQFKKPKQ